VILQNLIAERRAAPMIVVMPVEVKLLRHAISNRGARLCGNGSHPF
jgi:hypothetical protein